jgi:heavy metal translocating P-type ATPase
MSLKIKNYISETKWQALLSLASLAFIALHLILEFFAPQFSNWPLFFIIAVGGAPLSLQIIIRILNKNLGADVLAFIALILAVYLGQYLAANLIILMLASGQALEEYATHKASFVLEALAKRIPAIVHLKRGDQVFDVAMSEIKIGDLIEIYPHEICPVDGVVVEGSGAMNEAYLTGEPFKISKTIGSSVISGAINDESALVIKAEKLPKDSRYAKIVEVMQDAKQKRPRLRRLADQIGAIFAPVALVFALAVLFFTGDLTRFLAVLVVATPCPLLIAIPITIISAISISARRGIIIRDPAALERLPTCQTAIFDKTGTLTYGKPELTKINLLENFQREEILQMVASVECYSRHPLSSAILEAAKKENIKLLDVTNVSEKPGQGLVAKVSNREIFITSRKKIENLPKQEQGLECVVMVDSKLAALFQFRDTPRSESRPFISHLVPQHNFKKIILLSGDRSLEVEYLASVLEIENSYASQSPEQKLKIVRDETVLAPTLFMGDGINDAPALMAATVGIAFGKDNAVTSESAGVVVMDNTLIKVDELIHISEESRKIALQSAIGGMLLSLVGMGFAATGLMSPVFGALLQEVIDVAAILNALRLTWKQKIDSDLKLT